MERRKAIKMSVENLARRSGLGTGRLSKIERGLLKPPEIIPFVDLLAAALGYQKNSAEHRELRNLAYTERYGVVRTMEIVRPGRSANT